jgi:hypothetical protein
MASAIPLPQLTRFDVTIQQWIDQLNDYTLEQLRQVPRAGSWSLGQVYMHIIADTDWFAGQMEAALLTNADSDKDMHEDARRMFAADSFPDTQIQGPATDTYIPQPSSKEELAQRLTGIKATVDRLFTGFEPAVSVGKTRHPGLAFFSALEWLQFAEMHMRHHLRQKRRIDAVFFPTIKSLLSALLVCVSLTLFGQQKEYVIPFRLTEHNNLSVQAVLNGHDTVQLMFHTASSGIELTAASVKRLGDLHFERTDTVKSWGGDVNASRFSRHNSLQIGELQWPDLSIWEDENSGQGTDGKFGPDLFLNKTVELDFDRQVLVVRAGLPDKVRKYKRQKLILEKGNMYLEAVCKIGKTRYTNRFLIHSGYFGALLLDDRFVARSKADEKLKIVGEKDLKDAYGHVLKTEKAVLPLLVIGDQKLHDVPAGFFHGAIGRQKISVIGGDLLKRFNFIIDAQREYIYLKPNHLAKGAYLS